MLSPYRAEVYTSEGPRRLSDLARMRGQVLADAEQQKGASSANLIAGIGQQVGRSISDLAQYKMDQPRRELYEAEAASRRRAMGEADARKDTLKMVAGLPEGQQIEELRKAGLVDDANRLEDRMTTKADRAEAKEDRKIAQLHQRINQAKTVFGRGAAILTEAQKNPSLWPEIRPQVADLAGSLDPSLAEMIPQEYEPNQVGQLIASTVQLAEQYGQAEKALSDIDKGLKGIQTQASVLTGSAALLSTASTPEEWDGIKSTLKTLKVPEETLSRFGEFSEENLAKVQAIVRPEKKGEGYSLAPGASRFDESNRLVATAPQRPPTPEGPPKDDPALPVGTRAYITSLLDKHQGDYAAAEAEWNKGLAQEQAKHPRLDPGKARAFLREVFGYKPPSDAALALGDAGEFRSAGFSGEGGPGAPPPASLADMPSNPAPLGAGQAAAAPSMPKVGDVVTVRGQKVRITGIGPDGKLQGVPVP